MKVLSALLLTFIFILTGCGNTSSETDLSVDTSRYLKVSAPSTSSNAPVGIEQYVTLTFSAPIDGTTVNASSVYITDENKVPVASDLTVLKEKISIVPNEFFIYDHHYTIVVTTAVEDIEGRTIENTFTFPFLTASIPDTTAPSLTSVTPANGTSANKATDIIMTFDENIAGSGELQLKDSDSNTVINGTSTISGNTLQFVPNSDLTPGANYTVTLENTVEDLAGNTYTGITSWDFSVTPLVDTTAPTLILLTPADGTSADKSTDIIMAFSEEITNSGTELKLKNSDTNAVVHGTSIVNNNKMHFIPSNDLVPGANYTVTVLGPVTDLAGNAYEGITSWKFSVTPIVDATAPTLVSVTPTDGTSADTATDIVMAFSEEIAGDGELQLKDSDSNDIINGTATTSANQLGFVPDSDLTPGANYTVTVLNTVEDLAGNAYAGITSWDFSVTPLVDVTAPTLITLTPADGTSADKATDIIMAFSEEIAGDGVLQLIDSDSNDIIKGTATISANQLGFVPDSELTPGANYTVTLLNTVEDLAGNAYEGITSWKFSVTPLVDVTAPTLTSVTPADKTSADKATDIIMAFSEEIAGSGELQLTDSDSNDIINGTATTSANQLGFVPDSDLTPGANYTVTVLGPVTDLAGNAYAGITSWDFSVTPLVDVTAPTLITLTPADGTSADKATDIQMAFSEEIAGSGELQLTDSDSNDIINGTATTSANQLGFVPDSDLTPGANYTVTVLGPVTDLAGNAYAGITSWNFSVTPLVDVTAPTLITLTPADGTSADKATDIIMAFDEEITNGGVELKLKNSDVHRVIKGTSMSSNNILRFIPDSDLTPGDSYTVTLLGPVRDLAGNTYTGITSWSFSVDPEANLAVHSVTYKDDNKITIQFDGKLDKLTASESDFLINGGAITFSNFKFKDGDKAVEFQADSDLTGDEVISISGTIKDIDGNILNNGAEVTYSIISV